MSLKTSLLRSYVALGLSFDDKMGDDLTAACFHKASSLGEVKVQTGYNVGNGKNNQAMSSR